MDSASPPPGSPAPDSSAEGAGRITRALRELEDGDAGADERLFGLVYAELDRIARAYGRRERRQVTLEPSDLVHEAYLRLWGGELPRFENRAHLFFAFARAARQVLVERARARGAAKRGGDWQRVTVTGVRDLATPGNDGEVDLLDLHEALERLKSLHERHAQVVELRFFVGLTIPEVAETLGIGTSTVDADWAQARAWLQAELAN